VPPELVELEVVAVSPIPPAPPVPVPLVDPPEPFAPPTDVEVEPPALVVVAPIEPPVPELPPASEASAPAPPSLLPVEVEAVGPTELPPPAPVPVSSKIAESSGAEQATPNNDSVMPMSGNRMGSTMNGDAGAFNAQRGDWQA